MTLVYETSTSNYADFSVQVVHSPAIADLLVYRDKSRGAAQIDEGVWCFVDGRETSKKAVHFTKVPGFAQLKIFYVASRGLAGWLRNHRLRGRL
jgi:uncharacterized protein DUF6150